LPSLAATLRLAVDAGIVIVSHKTGQSNIGDLVGRVLGDASTLRTHSNNQTVVVSDAVRIMAADAFIFAPLEPTTPADRFGSQLIRPPTWSVTACKPSLQLRDRRAPRLIGNTHQRAVLERALMTVQAGGRQVMIITGEAGIGKSALFRHFRAQVAASKTKWIEATCRPEHAHATLQPIRELLRHALPKADMNWLTGATQAPPPAAPVLAELEPPDRQLLSRFFNADVLGTRPASSGTAPFTADPTANRPDWPSNRQFRLVNLLIAIIGHVASAKSTVLAIEDLHWADGETLKFLRLLVERSARWPKFGLVLVARRRDDLPHRVTQGATMVIVERLSDSDIVELLMPARQLAPDILRLIARRSEGVPLFAEQLAALYADTATPQKASAILASPTSLNLILAARLDALGTDKSLAQSAAVLGRDFDLAVLASMMSTAPAELRTGIAALVASGLVTPVTDRPHVSHRFSHALVRDAAYASLLKQRRRQLHVQAANTITQDFPALARANPEAIALHYSEAGVNTTAAQWWRLAAEGALSLSQLTVAVTHLQRGLTLLAGPADTPDCADQRQRDEELAIRRLLGPCLTMLAGNGADAVIANYRRCLQLTAGSASTPFEILWGLHGCHSVRGELADALEIGERAIVVAEASTATRDDIDRTTGDRANTGDEQCLLAHRMQGLTRLQAGDIAQAISHYREVKRRYQPERHETMRFRFASDQGVLAQAHWAWAEAVAGNLATSDQLADQALARADDLQHPHSSAHVVAVLAARAQTLGQRVIAAPLALAARNLAQAHGFTYWSAWSEIILGWHEAALSPENSLIRIERAIQDYRRTGAGQALPYAMLLKAEVALDAGLWELAIHTTTNGLKLARDGRIGLYIGELLRVRALALVQGPAPAIDEAQLALADAMAISLQQGTLFFAMRAAVAQLQGSMTQPAAPHLTQQAVTVLRHVLSTIAGPASPRKASYSAEITAAVALAAAPPDGRAPQLMWRAN
jgi:tetratricopeptide (TPR) repeat protein